jgi:predicted Rossmann fold flavoprotein
MSEVNLDKIVNKQPEIWDVIVIGGGPAGMMSAIRASERGGKVLLIEKNDILGKKLLITGGGRCNVTNAELDNRKLLSKFKDSDKYLFSAFSKWSVKNTLDFFNSRNMPTKVEANQRVFPVSNSAKSVWDVLVNDLKKNNVSIISNTEVKGFIKEQNKIIGVKLKNKNIIHGKNFILATGGKSRPETGSTGDGFIWLKEIGHKVIEQDAVLVPVAIKDEWVKRIQGVTIDNVKITLYQNNEKQGSNMGKILFTHFGLSGPSILNMSRDISELLKYGEVFISLDVLPSLDYGMLNEKLQNIFKENSNKKFKNALTELFKPSFAETISNLSDINGDTWCHSITREQRLSLVKLLKDIQIQVSGLLGVEKAIVTSGGIDLNEVDFKTMKSKIYDNLFLVGDILNIDRPSGGYSLQLCWTTGFVAGDSVEII